MEITAQAKYVRTSSRKLRLVRDAIKGVSSPKQAQVMLKFLNKRAAGPLSKVLGSAVANATFNAKKDEASLKIKKIDIDEGPTLWRWRAGSRGTAKPIAKRTSHIKVTLEAE